MSTFHNCGNISIKFNFSNGDFYITEWNDVLPQIAQFYNESILDFILVASQSTVYETPENDFKKRPKHVGASAKCF